MRYVTQKRLVLGLFLLYFVMGMGNDFSSHWIFNPPNSAERYPFFSWDLFSRVPGEQSLYTIEFTHLEGVDYDPPIPFSKPIELFTSRRTSPTEYTTTIHDLGDAYTNGNKAEIQKGIEKLDNFFGESEYTYRVIFVTYDPVEYWKDGTRYHTTTLAEVSSFK